MQFNCCQRKKTKVHSQAIIIRSLPINLIALSSHVFASQLVTVVTVNPGVNEA